MQKIRRYAVTGFCCLCLAVWGVGCEEKTPDTAEKPSVKQKIPVEQPVSPAGEKEPAPEKEKPAKTGETPETSAETPAAAKKAGPEAKDAKDEKTVTETPATTEKRPAETPEAGTAEPAGSIDQAADASSREKEKATAEGPETASAAAPVESVATSAATIEAGESEEEMLSEEGAITEEIEAIEEIKFDLDLEDEGEEGRATQAKKAEDVYNPFAPLFQKEKTALQQGGETDDNRNRAFITPLEKIGLGQVTLKGIIQASSGNRAIVTDASGKGYVLKKGTYIGLRSGRVEQITADRVIVVEIVDGRESIAELKLQKSAGE